MRRSYHEGFARRNGIFCSGSTDNHKSYLTGRTPVNHARTYFDAQRAEAPSVSLRRAFLFLE